MLQKEFEERIGRSVSEEEYVEANAMYMAAGEMDKDEFCREWEQIGESALVQGLFEKAYDLNAALQEQKLMTDECQGMLSDAADAMLAIADGLLGGETAERGTCDEDAAEVPGEKMITAGRRLTRTAWYLVGQKEVTRRRVEKGYRLDDKDRETIINSLINSSNSNLKK